MKKGKKENQQIFNPDNTILHKLFTGSRLACTPERDGSSRHGSQGQTMDKIIKITLGLFIVILVAFTGIITYTTYTETAYKNSLAGTYTYTCTITTDAPLYNVTLFIPVPADLTGNSPMVSGFSSHMMNGVPAEWDTTLFDTGKSTLL
jgi:hypothetical protein